MIKYVSYAVTFTEVPDEVCLTIQISNCPHRCIGCHSSYLQEDVGRDLEEDLPDLLDKYKGRVTCVCFMGDGNDYFAYNRLLFIAKLKGFKTAIYSGYDWADCEFRMFYNLDYLKIGPYIQSLGGLNHPGTNQRMYRCETAGIDPVKLKRPVWEDITYKFWKEKT